MKSRQTDEEGDRKSERERTIREQNKNKEAKNHIPRSLTCIVYAQNTSTYMHCDRAESFSKEWQ